MPLPAFLARVSPFEAACATIEGGASPVLYEKRRPEPLFRIKICGVTSLEDAREALAAGADALGFNFYSASPRYLAPDAARKLVQAVAGRAVRVGVFANAPLEWVCETFDALQLDLIQVHGDEPPDYLARLGGRPVVCAVRLDADSFDAVCDRIRHIRAGGADLRMVLADARQPGAYGGSGKTADWPTAVRLRKAIADLPLVLAGGLTPENVRQAVEIVQPWAVDVASGVEAAPGKKDPPKVRAFVAEARQALARLRKAPQAND